MNTKGYYTFEEFMREQHMEDYRGTDDDAPDDFDNWLGELDGEEYMEYAEKYGRLLTKLLSNKRHG